MPLLSIRSLGKTFGGLTALSSVDFDVEEGEIRALIGPNGAGKTTLVNIVSGVYQPDSGEILFHGEKISGMSPVTIARKGISRTFQQVELFGNMSVLENIMVSREAKGRAGFFASGLRLPFAREREKRAREKSEEILSYINLSHRREECAANLPIGEQRILEIGRALSTDPRLLLLDEPAAGLNIRETRSLGEMIRRIRDELKVTIVLVEHDMDLVMGISDTVTVLNFGKVIAEGTPLEVQRNPDVILAYLGEEEETTRGYHAGS